MQNVEIDAWPFVVRQLYRLRYNNSWEDSLEQNHHYLLWVIHTSPHVLETSFFVTFVLLLLYDLDHLLFCLRQVLNNTRWEVSTMHILSITNLWDWASFFCSTHHWSHSNLLPTSCYPHTSLLQSQCALSIVMFINNVFWAFGSILSTIIAFFECCKC